MSGVSTPRRYYLLKRLAAEARCDTALAGVWQVRQLAYAWPDLPTGFPARAALMAAGYTTVRDLDGAELSELTTLGLPTRDAEAVLLTMERWTMIPTVLLSPSYLRQDGRVAEVYDAPLIPSGTLTATATGGTYEMGDMTTLRLLHSVTAASGTLPTLDSVVETSHDGSTNWQQVGRFGQKTTTGTERQVFSGCDRFVRVVNTLGGTLPSFTFSITGEAC